MDDIELGKTRISERLDEEFAFIQNKSLCGYLPSTVSELFDRGQERGFESFSGKRPIRTAPLRDTTKPPFEITPFYAFDSSCLAAFS